MMFAIKHRSIDGVKLLIHYGVDVNKTNEDGVSPLMVAVTCTGQHTYHVFYDILSILLIAGAKPNAQTMYGWTAIHFIFSKYRVFIPGKPDCIKLLLEYDANPDIKNDNGRSPLQLAYESPEFTGSGKLEISECVKLLREKSKEKDIINQQAQRESAFNFCRRLKLVGVGIFALFATGYVVRKYMQHKRK